MSYFSEFGQIKGQKVKGTKKKKKTKKKNKKKKKKIDDRAAR